MLLWMDWYQWHHLRYRFTQIETRTFRYRLANCVADQEWMGRLQLGRNNAICPTHGRMDEQCIEYLDLLVKDGIWP